MGFRDGQFVFCNANCEFLSAEIERIHPVRVPSSAHLVPLDGIEDDDGVLFAGDRGLVRDIGGGIANLSVGVSIFVAHEQPTQGRKGPICWALHLNNDGSAGRVVDQLLPSVPRRACRAILAGKPLLRVRRVPLLKLGNERSQERHRFR